MSSARFPLGQIVASRGVLKAFARTNQAPAEFLARHVTVDWGDLDEHDRQENEWSLHNDGRLLSAYLLRDDTKIWIITEADRSATTLLLPEEY